MKIINKVVSGTVLAGAAIITSGIAIKNLIDKAKDDEYKKGYVDASYECGDILKKKTDEFSDQITIIKEVEEDKDKYIDKLENYISEFNEKE